MSPQKTFQRNQPLILNLTGTPNDHPALEIFLNKLENEVFSVLPGTPRDNNLSKEEWLTMRGLVEDRNINIKPADKGSCIVLWDREYCLAEVEKQLQDVEIYEDNDFKASDLVKLLEKSNTIFQSLRNKNLITEKELKCFCYQDKKSTILIGCIFFRKFIRD